MSDSIRIELAKHEFVDDIVDCQIRLALESENLQLDRKTVTRGVEHVFSNPMMGYYIAAVDENELVGCALITYEWSDWRNGLVLWLHSLYVLPEFRRRNIFKRIWSFVQQRIQLDEKIKGLRLYVDSQNFMAKNVYHRIGMKTGHYEIFEWMRESDN